MLVKGGPGTNTNNDLWRHIASIGHIGFRWVEQNIALFALSGHDDYGAVWNGDEQSWSLVDAGDA